VLTGVTPCWTTTPAHRPQRTAPPQPLLRVVLDSALRMPLDSKLVATAQNDLVVFTVSNDEAALASSGSAVCASRCYR